MKKCINCGQFDLPGLVYCTITSGHDWVEIKKEATEFYATNPMHDKEFQTEEFIESRRLAFNQGWFECEEQLQQKIQVQDKLIEELEIIIDIIANENKAEWSIVDGQECTFLAIIITKDTENAKQALAKIKEHRDSNHSNKKD